MSRKIDINFNVFTDTPKGKDPDAYSQTLREYHKILWSKSLPGGELFTLDNSTKGYYLRHNSHLGDFTLSSDSITNSYKNTRLLSDSIRQELSDEISDLFSVGSTIGAFIIFPRNPVNRKPNINQARGMNSRIKDRFDLTLECIRRYYLNEESPLKATIKRYPEYFSLFKNFQGYVDFFLLQDLVAEDYSQIKFYLPFIDFDQSPVPSTPDEYLTYKNKTVNFVTSRAKRMVESVS